MSSEPRRRIYLYVTKYDEFSVPRRFKLLIMYGDPWGPGELEWELRVLDALEKDCYSKMDSLGIPEADQQYYLGYAKRLWEKKLKFGSETYLLERTSLRNEYILRGWSSAVLDQLEPYISTWAEVKKTRVWPAPPELIEFEYGGGTLGDAASGWFEWSGLTVLASDILIYFQWSGVDLDGGDGADSAWHGVDLIGGDGADILWPGVTVVVGTP